MNIFSVTHEHFYHPDKATADQLSWLIRGIGILNRNMEKLMSSFDDLKAAQADTDAAIAKIKTDVETMLAKLANIPVAGMTPEQQAALDEAVAHAKSMNTTMGAIDASANPAP